LTTNSNLTTSIGGMETITTGIDRHKLSEVAKGYNIDIFKYMFAVDMFENGILESQSRARDKKN